MKDPFPPRPEVIEIEGIGEIFVERSKRARRLSISVRPFRGPRVALPYGIPFEKAEAILHKNLDWLKKHMARIKKIEEAYEASSKNLAPLEDARAREIILGRLRELSARHPFCYRRVSIRRQKTRWGSCSEANGLSLNIRLAQLPWPLIDYVLFHELVHTRIKNHSRTFWEELEKYVPDAKALAHELKKYCLDIF